MKVTGISLRIDQFNRLKDMALPGHPYVTSAIDIARQDLSLLGDPVAVYR